MSWFWRRGKKKPKFEHPCPVCQVYGREVPHRGQHAVMYAPKPKPTPGAPPPQGRV